MKAKTIFCQTKNTGDHSKFKINCITNIQRINRFSLFKPCCKNKYNDIPIITYKIGQTIENTELGGVNNDLFNN